MEHHIRSMSDEEPPLQIDPVAIECGYLAYPQSLHDLIQSGQFNPHDALETNQSDFWPIVRRHDPQMLVHLMMAMPKVEVDGLEPALREVGFFDGYSIAVGDMKFSLDGGATMQQLFVGFCWKSPTPEIILLRPNGVVPISA